MAKEVTDREKMILEWRGKVDKQQDANEKRIKDK